MLTSKRTLSQTGDHSATLFKMVAISILTIFFYFKLQNKTGKRMGSCDHITLRRCILRKGWYYLRNNFFLPLHYR